MIAGLVGFRFLLDSGLHVADAARPATDSEAPAARDVDDAAPLVTAEGRLGIFFFFFWGGGGGGQRV
jgi:hypothetical protein